jgi:hypothetical protein
MPKVVGDGSRWHSGRSGGRTRLYGVHGVAPDGCRGRRRRGRGKRRALVARIDIQRVLELAHPGAKGTAELGQAFGAEQEQGDYQQ